MTKYITYCFFSVIPVMFFSCATQHANTSLQPQFQLNFIVCNNGLDPNELLKDTDNDGVVDMRDNEPVTPPGAAVDLHGITLDSDHDDCMDFEDPEPMSAQTIPVIDCENVRIGCIFDSNAILNPTAWYIPVLSFAVNKYDILTDKEPALLYVEDVMLHYPEITVHVTGYAHPQNETSPLQLSENRVKSVVAFLVSCGIEENRFMITYQGRKFISVAGKDCDPGFYGQRFVEFVFQLKAE